MMARKPANSANNRPISGSALRVVALTSDELPTFEFGIVAGVFASPPVDGEAWYDLQLAAEHPEQVVASGGIRVSVSGGLEKLNAADLIIVPGWSDPTQRPSKAVATALAAAHEQGSHILSICSGAFVLAEAGILDGRRATTHWSRTELFASRYPGVTLVPDAIYVDEGEVMTSAGGAAGLDLLLHYIRGRHGSRIANIIARQLVVPPHRQGYQLQRNAQPVAAVTTDRIAAVIDWMADNFTAPLSVRELSARALMSERTFARRFRQVTGQSAISWLINLRLERAKQLLDESRLPIEVIAAQSGFADADALRHHFRQVLGHSPKLYRAGQGANNGRSLPS